MLRFRIVLMMICVALVPSRTARPHGDAEWIADGNFVSAAGERCCGEQDCHAVPPQSVQLIGDTYFIADGNRTYSIKDRDAQDSIDERYWLCAWGVGLKCFFRPKLGF